MEIIATWTLEEINWRLVHRDVSERREVPGAGHSGADLVTVRRSVTGERLPRGHS